MCKQSPEVAGQKVGGQSQQKSLPTAFCNAPNSIVIELVHAATELKIVAAGSLHFRDGSFVLNFISRRDGLERNHKWKERL